MFNITCGRAYYFTFEIVNVNHAYILYMKVVDKIFFFHYNFLKVYVKRMYTHIQMYIQGLL